MRSLWRLMALRWLGDEGSEVLTGDSVLFDLLPPGRADPVFRVARDPHARALASTATRAPGIVEEEDLDQDASPHA